MPFATSPTLRLVKPFAAALISIICGWILWGQLQHVSLTEIGAALTQISPPEWGVALIATAFSFAAIGQYDAIWHRILGNDVSPGSARATGMAAIAVGQTIGFGTVTSGLVRWHLLANRSLKAISTVSIAVSLSFLACWAVLGTAAAIYADLISVQTGGLAILGAVIAAAGFSNRISIARSAFKAAPKLLVMSGLDILFAGIALWVLIPDASIASLPLILAAYCLALGNGLISNAPGGVGAFDLTLIALVPMLPEAQIIAGLLAFRVVYYIVPASFAAALMLVVQIQRMRKSPTPRHSYAAQRRHLLGSVLLDVRHGHAIAAPGTGFHALYKCDKRTATAARACGWTVRLISRDAMINPQEWSSDGSKTRQLRRKLRQAQKAGVTITQETTLPQQDLDAIARIWARNHGGELGYSMSRFHPTTLCPETTFLIWDNTNLCGFITISEQGGTWTLDLIRHLSDMPNGAVQLAIAQVIGTLKTRGETKLSLGAVPAGPLGCPITTITQRGKSGLMQFKDAFAPSWEPRFHAAPTFAQAVASLLLITCHIQRPVGRMHHHLKAFQAKLINIPQIIHLIHPAGRGTSPQ